MTESTPEALLPTPLRCLTGSAIAGVMAFLMYLLTSRIATSFARTPVSNKSQAAVNISVAVRTLVTGMTALGMSVFGIISLGLIVLAVKVAFSRDKSGKSA